MLRRLLSVLVGLLCWPAMVQAQTAVTVLSGDKVQWDQCAATLADAQRYVYNLFADEDTPELFAVRLEPVTCPGTVSQAICKDTRLTPFVCTAPLPSLPPGPHTLKVQTTASYVSPQLAITKVGTDARCVFPTGALAVVLFPTRLLTSGAQVSLSFFVGTTTSPLEQVSVWLQRGTDAAARVAVLGGSELTGVGAIWFDRPKAPGSYAVSVRARNRAGCTTTVSTSYVVVVT